ncbi:MAG TPA: hypothetical protein VM513_04325 [Kofleriaceae bacterium]|nr:hypothetical protein [Kofleriaceae bacterium]
MRSLALLALLTSTHAHAESTRYENVRVDVGVLGAVVDVSDRHGTGMGLEIKGMANDHLALGGRVEFAVMFGGVVGEDEAPLDLGVAASGVVKAEYLFGNATVRPFVGFGLGGYSLTGHTIAAGPDHDAISTKTGRYVGMAPQLGVDLGRVRVSATYNAILGAYLELRSSAGGGTTRLSQNWLSLELSFQFAGGRKQVSQPGR